MGHMTNLSQKGVLLQTEDAQVNRGRRVGKTLKRRNNMEEGEPGMDGWMDGGSITE